MGKIWPKMGTPHILLNKRAIVGDLNRSPGGTLLSIVE